jgi:hypothetical protein
MSIRPAKRGLFHDLIHHSRIANTPALRGSFIAPGKGLTLPADTGYRRPTLSEVPVKIAISLALSALYAYIVYLGFICGVEGAQNIIKLYVFAICLPVGLVATFSDDVQRGLAKNPANPEWLMNLSLAMSLLYIGVIAWTGHMVTAACYLIAVGCFYSAMAEVSKIRNEAHA